MNSTWKLLAAASCAAVGMTAQCVTLQVTSVAAGYTSRSLEIGAPFAGSIAADPADVNKLYVSTGGFNSHAIVAVNAANGTTQTVTPVLGTVGGIAVLSDGSLVITENGTSDTILRARDFTADNDFLDANEVTELIAPILHDGNFSGAQLVVAPGGAPGIAAGSLVVQTADGNTSSELLVINSPATAPAYQPAGGAYYSGFQYNGGVSFSPGRHVVMGESRFNFSTFTSTGRILGLVNSNADTYIDAGESHVIVDEPELALGVTDLAVSSNGIVYFGENSGMVRYFALPGNLLTGTAAPANFASTNGVYLSAIRLDDPTRDFAPGATASTARLYVGGYVGAFEQATNLVVIEPAGTSSVADWALFE